jgi:hypothetical protein
MTARIVPLAGETIFMRVMQEPYNVLRWLVLSVFCQSLMLLLPLAQGIKFEL